VTKLAIASYFGCLLEDEELSQENIDTISLESVLWLTLNIWKKRSVYNSRWLSRRKC